MRLRASIFPLALLLLAATLAATLTACFDPLTPGCAFSCGPNAACPAAYVCAADGLCHRQDKEDGKGQCGISPSDGGAD